MMIMITAMIAVTITATLTAAAATTTTMTAAALEQNRINYKIEYHCHMILFLLLSTQNSVAYSTILFTNAAYLLDETTSILFCQVAGLLFFFRIFLVMNSPYKHQTSTERAPYNAIFFTVLAPYMHHTCTIHALYMLVQL